MVQRLEDLAVAGLAARFCIALNGLTTNMILSTLPFLNNAVVLNP